MPILIFSSFQFVKVSVATGIAVTPGHKSLKCCDRLEGFRKGDGVLQAAALGRSKGSQDVTNRRPASQSDGSWSAVTVKMIDFDNEDSFEW